MPRPGGTRSAGEDRPPGADHLDSEIRIDVAERLPKGVHGHRGVSSRARDDREERLVALSQRQIDDRARFAEDISDVRVAATPITVASRSHVCRRRHPKTPAEVDNGKDHGDA